MAKFIKDTLQADHWKNEGPNKMMVHSWNGGKVMLFWLKNGQKIPVHTNPNRVHVSVLKGKASFVTGTETGIILGEGESVSYEPGENHGFEALEDTVLQAVIAADLDKI